MLMKYHILVVDDDPALRTLFAALLESYGYTSKSEDNGQEAVTKLEQAPYDAVLLDYMMPEMTGLTVLQYIQQRHPSVPAVMITGHTNG